MAAVLEKNILSKTYQLSAQNSSATISSYDSGTILGTVPPGKTGLKLTDGTQQSSTNLLADSTAGVDGNFTQDPAVFGQAAGFSLLGE